MNRSSHGIAAICAAAALAACTAVPPRDTAVPSAPAAAAALQALADCRERPEAGQQQYIIGYGSLMQDESRQRTSPRAGAAYPVEVAGYRRGWFAKVDPTGASATFLGLVPDPRSHLNAVIYAIDADELVATDRREASYCRVRVASSAIRALAQQPALPDGAQAWIYANKPEAIAPASARAPIVQSYVDIFVSGCLEQEQRFALDGFARECLSTTHDWSAQWVNDRLYPRRPFIYQPKARQIDTLLKSELPQYFSRIVIE